MRHTESSDRIRIAWIAIGLTAVLAPGLANATGQDYILEFPAKQMISYRIDFEVTNSGRLAVEMNWSGNRVVTFKLQGPDGGQPTLRRSGPPPLRMQYDIDKALASRAGQWTLSIRGLPAHEDASGMLTLYLPESQDHSDQAPTPIPEVDSPPDELWLRPVRISDGLSAERTRLVQATEQFRVAVTDRKSRDRYDWQVQMLRYLAEHRDKHSELPDHETRLILERSAKTVRKIEELSVSTDPFVVDPPEDPSLRRAWLVLRERRIEPIEMELDSMLHAIHKGRVPELEEQEWFARFVSSVMTCEQYFEERGRLGRRRARNSSVVVEQWERILLAADALDSLVDVAASESAE